MGESETAFRIRQEVEQFLYHEAWLLDEGRLHEWIELFTDDTRYWMPVRETIEGRPDGLPTDDELALPIFDDDKAFLMMRAKRLDTGLAHAEEPRSRTRHLITNIWVDELADDEITAHSNFLLFQVSRNRSQDVYVGRREDRLRKENGEWRIAKRKIVLEQSVLPRTLSILV